MDDKTFEVAKHIKWSKTKFGAISIYDRVNRRSFLIDTISGRATWERILRKATMKELVEEIKQKFETDKSSDEIERDMTDFMKDLANANVVHILK
ncbi:MAG: PqqD family protein [Candidatus Zixiibacteriota bacterium]